jgi:hypothetical protein
MSDADARQLLMDEIEKLESENTQLRARVADLKETIKAIRAVNVTEFGTVGDEAVERLISSCAAIDTAKETDK